MLHELVGRFLLSFEIHCGVVERVDESLPLEDLFKSVENSFFRSCLDDLGC